MKNILYGVFSVLVISMFTGCFKDDAINQNPRNQISKKSFWNSSKDLELFANSFYQRLSTQGSDLEVYEVMGIYTHDQHSDNMISEAPDKRLNGQITVSGSDPEWE